MPIYEEKLICPLAVRFTQQRIRETFKDGHDVEATIDEITAVPGVDGYDIILDMPFPCIEIVRWSANGRGAGRDDHWFSFDNRRLYCLQRAASECWPKRVAIPVHVLYADAGTIRKKLDSRTQGLSVSIGHAFATPDELETWAWRNVVQGRAPPGLEVSMLAEEAVSADDSKTRVSDLLDAPSPASVGQVAVPSSPPGGVLTSLIGQLLELESKDSGDQKSDEDSSTASPDESGHGDSADSDFADAATAPVTPIVVSREPSLAAPPGTFFPTELDEAAGVQLDHAGKAKPEKGSLTMLIGQLLELDDKECRPLGERKGSMTLCSQSAEPCQRSRLSSRFAATPVSLAEDLSIAASTPLASKQAHEAAAVAEWTTKLLQLQGAQLQMAQCAQAAQFAHFQAMRARQTMSYWAAHSAFQRQYYP